jgi:hypothetical protein
MCDVVAPPLFDFPIDCREFGNDHSGATQQIEPAASWS